MNNENPPSGTADIAPAANATAAIAGTGTPTPGTGDPGGWPSPLAASAIAAGAGNLAELRACDGRLFWLESRPAEGGRTTLLCTTGPTDEIRELTPAPGNVRSRVHEYGGGAYLPTSAGVFLVDDQDGEIHLLAPDGQRRPLTDCAGTARFADFALDTSRQRLLAVCERPGHAEPENLLVAIPLAGPPVAPEALTVLHRGHDFYAAPRLAPDQQRLAFIAWDHPDMPWDGTVLVSADIADDGTLTRETIVAGGSGEAVQQPLWTADGGLVFASDRNGWWNVCRFDASGVHCLLADGAEYAEAPWVLGMSTITEIGRGWLATVRRADGVSDLVLLDTGRGFAAPTESVWREHESLCYLADPALGDSVAFIGRRADGPPAVVRRRLTDGAETLVATAALPEMPEAAISAAEPLTLRARDGGALHALYYPPRHPQIPLPAGARPPLLVTVHGGPTARASAALNLRTQYFTTRGWGVLEVDYRGSSGYGRDYRERLNGRWGELDAADCEDAALALVHAGRADPDRIAIRGSSAGGLTVLASLTRSHVFRAGASLYGIGDLEALARETHKFESRYIDGLVGDLATCRARSPITHADRIRVPVLFLQGSEDRVVPPTQANAMVAALRARRVPVAHVEFPGEGHGFRRAEHIEQALEYEYAFYCRVFGITTSNPLRPLEIDLP